MAKKLQVTISHELARAFQESYRAQVEASSEPIDPQLDMDYGAFCDSVRAAVQRKMKQERRDRIMKQAREAVG